MLSFMKRQLRFKIVESTKSNPPLSVMENCMAITAGTLRRAIPLARSWKPPVYNVRAVWQRQRGEIFLRLYIQQQTGQPGHGSKRSYGSS